MRILVVDDDEMKYKYIAACLKKDNPENQIRWQKNYEEATEFISRNADYIDLILLDWCFPSDSYSRSQFAMGKRVLTYMNMMGLTNDVIICSSDMISINQTEFPFVKGAICYWPDYSIVNQIHEFLKPQEEIEEHKDVVIRSLKPKKPNDCSGYKRHKSSQPWWQK